MSIFSGYLGRATSPRSYGLARTLPLSLLIRRLETRSCIRARLFHASTSVSAGDRRRSGGGPKARDTKSNDSNIPHYNSEASNANPIPKRRPSSSRPLQKLRKPQVSSNQQRRKDAFREERESRQDVVPHLHRSQTDSKDSKYKERVRELKESIRADRQRELEKRKPRWRAEIEGETRSRYRSPRSSPTPVPVLKVKKMQSGRGGLPELKEFYGTTSRRGKSPSSSFPSSSFNSAPNSGLGFNSPPSPPSRPKSKPGPTSGKGFSAPPLLPSLRTALYDVLGPDAQPTEIQKLSMEQIVGRQTQPREVNSTEVGGSHYAEYLLASETGSGKSIAYLMPLVQGLKESEHHPSSLTTYTPKRDTNPRALVLAPTHELARQLAGFTKALTHEDGTRLVVKCVSRGNEPTREKKSKGNGKEQGTEGAGMTRRSDEMNMEIEEGSGLTQDAQELIVRPAGSPSSLAGSDLTSRPVDILVGTPTKFLDMVFGRGWDRPEDDDQDGADDDTTKRRSFNLDPNSNSRRTRTRLGRPTLGLSQIQYVIIDEADVLFDEDFRDYTRLLLDEVTRAKTRTDSRVDSDSSSSSPLSPSPPSPTPLASNTGPSSPSIPTPSYPFNLILSTATIPPSLATYLSTNHPRLRTLQSSRIHKLPEGVDVEKVQWSGGNRYSDVEKRLRKVWMGDERAAGGMSDTAGMEHLEEKGIKTVTLTSKIAHTSASASDESADDGFGYEDETSKGKEKEGNVNPKERRQSQRLRGSNKHLEGFLRVRSRRGSRTSPGTDSKAERKTETEDYTTQPHVLLTTSLLSRGLDFAPEVNHIFIFDEPRNVIDFLHRAGRTGRMGPGMTGRSAGRVVVFGRGGGGRDSGRFDY